MNPNSITEEINRRRTANVSQALESIGNELAPTAGERGALREAQFARIERDRPLTPEEQIGLRGKLREIKQMGGVAEGVDDAALDALPAKITAGGLPMVDKWYDATAERYKIQQATGRRAGFNESKEAGQIRASITRQIDSLTQAYPLNPAGADRLAKLIRLADLPDSSLLSEFRQMAKGAPGAVAPPAPTPAPQTTPAPAQAGATYPPDLANDPKFMALSTAAKQIVLQRRAASAGGR